MKKIKKIRNKKLCVFNGSLLHKYFCESSFLYLKVLYSISFHGCTQMCSFWYLNFITFCKHLVKWKKEKAIHSEIDFSYANIDNRWNFLSRVSTCFFFYQSYTYTTVFDTQSFWFGIRDEKRGTFQINNPSHTLWKVVNNIRPLNCLCSKKLFKGIKSSE